MYYLLLFRILFLVGFFHRELINAEINNNEELLLNNFGFDSNQSKEIKIVVDNILKNYISTPNNKLSPQRNSSLTYILDVTFISDTITNEIENTFRNIGLINLNKKKRQIKFPRNKNSSLTFGNSMFHKILPFFIKLSPIFQAIASTLQYYFRKNNYRQKGYLRSDFSLPKIITQSSPNEFKVVSLVDNSEKYINAYLNCWNNNFTLFNASKAFINIVKYPPKKTGRIVKSRLSKSIPRHPYKSDKLFTEFDAITCQLLIENNSEITFKNCLKQLELIDKCVEITFNKSLKSDKLKWRSTRMLKETINDLDSNCKVAKNSNDFKLICQKNINKSDPLTDQLLTLLKRILKRLRKVLSKDKIWADLFEQIDAIIDAYNMIASLQKESITRSKNQPHLIKEYNKRSKQLHRYTKSLTEIGINTIDQIRRITRTIEEVLVKIVSTTGINLSNNLRSMNSFDKIFNKIKKHLLNKSNSTLPKDKTYEEIWRTKRPIKKNNNHELAIRSKVPVVDLSIYFNNDWLKTMRGLSQINIHRNSNTITTLANVFLLATLFHEFIIIFAEAIFHREREPDIQSPSLIPPNFGHPDDVYEYQSYDDTDSEHEKLPDNFDPHQSNEQQRKC
ncbi:hypothetical protein PV325_000986 [Microctonus aethiopoides]|uniref:Uncharacterized protein n=1 Tax=Microctonus aethiopoides TaxID=144406 RepID=A0AA39FNS7_9HYME|nr:hypothetical protein PV325_000986 [Microctonus aethiopoides]KAK0172903.1 hypothetical protein PV328_006168 [Microctonus aethiopoides]